MLRHPGFVALLALAPLVACRKMREQPADTAGAGAMAAAADRAIAAGTPIVIHTKNGAVDLGLANDTVYMGLSDSVRARARTGMDTASDQTGSDFGNALGRVIEKTVSNALQTRISYPVADINSARYEDGTIKFDYRNKHRLSFENVNVDHDGNALRNFAPDDARQFVADVNAAIRAQRAGQ